MFCKDEDKFNPDTSKPLFCVVSIVIKAVGRWTKYGRKYQIYPL